MNQPVRSPQLNLLQVAALGIGLVGVVLIAMGALLDTRQFYHSYLYGFMFVLAFSLGSLAFSMINHLGGGGWGLATRRILESASLTLPFVALLFVPIALTVTGDMASQHYLYEWADPAVVAADPILQAKQIYLNPQGFLIRAVIYFAIWIIWSFTLSRFSLAQDRTANPRLAQRMRAMSGAGIVLYVITMTLAATDWVMSLDPHWVSTMFGVIFMIGQGVATLALGLIVLSMISNRAPMEGVVKNKHIHDNGKLLFGFVILWAYVSFAQYVIIWSGDVAEFVPWYIRRSQGEWQIIAWVLMLFHFFVPFFILLSRKLKKSINALAVVALFLIFMRLVDLFYLIKPEFNSTLSIHWMDVVVPLGLGGIWLALFIWLLKRRPLLPVNDPNFQEAFGHHGH